MSLLFDALNRAQGNEAKPLQMPDASSHLPSGSNEHPAAKGNEAAKSLLSVGNKPQTHILPYAVGGLVLLAGVAGWFFYQQNQLSSLTPLQPVAGVAPFNQTLAASQAVAAPGATRQLALANTTDGANTTGVANTATATNKAKNGMGSSSTRSASPRATNGKHAKKHPAKHKTARSGVLASTRHDPLKEAYQALSEGRLNQAEQSYLAVLAQHPHEKDALLGLAVIAQRKMQAQRATDLYQQVLREDLGNVTAAAGLVSLSVQADPVAAESQLKQLLDLKPNAPEFHHALGNVLARQLRWGEAQQAFFRAYSLSPGNALYAYNLAVALEHLHQPTAALPYYEKALLLARPSDPTLDRGAIEHRIQELNKTESR